MGLAGNPISEGIAKGETDNGIGDGHDQRPEEDPQINVFAADGAEKSGVIIKIQP
jgi:hypothetical protein